MPLARSWLAAVTCTVALATAHRRGAPAPTIELVGVARLHAAYDRLHWGFTVAAPTGAELADRIARTRAIFARRGIAVELGAITDGAAATDRTLLVETDRVASAIAAIREAELDPALHDPSAILECTIDVDPSDRLIDAADADATATAARVLGRRAGDRHVVTELPQLAPERGVGRSLAACAAGVDLEASEVQVYALD